MMKKLVQWLTGKYWEEGVGMGESYGNYPKCSICGNELNTTTNTENLKYCPFCGKEMGTWVQVDDFDSDIRDAIIELNSIKCNDEIEDESTVVYLAPNLIRWLEDYKAVRDIIFKYKTTDLDYVDAFNEIVDICKVCKVEEK